MEFVSVDSADTNGDNGSRGELDELKSVLAVHVQVPRVGCKTDENTYRVLLPMESRRDAESFARDVQRELPEGRFEFQITMIGETSAESKTNGSAPGASSGAGAGASVNGNGNGNG